MTNSLPQKGNSFPRQLSRVGSSALDWLSSFRVIYVAIFTFAVLHVFSVEFAEFLLQRRFETQVAQAVQAEDPTRLPSEQIREQVHQALYGSVWTRLGGVRANAYVLGADGLLLYPGPYQARDNETPDLEAARVLPVSIDVVVSLSHNSLVAVTILIFYAALLLWGLFRYTRAIARREADRLRQAESAREAAAGRASQIEQELDAVRDRLAHIDPAETPHANEIRQLRAERLALQEKLSKLAHREEELSAQAARSVELDDERRALEELLEEALGDVSQKEQEIQDLRERAQRAPKESTRTRDADQIGRRLRTLYKNLELDDRAIDDIVKLRDGLMILKAEEALKRLSDEVSQAAVRRKVGGLPPGLPVFELGYAGKGRIYYTRGEARRFRILCVGAKNTQNSDLEYLSRVVRQSS